MSQPDDNLKATHDHIDLCTPEAGTNEGDDDSATPMPRAAVKPQERTAVNIKLNTWRSDHEGCDSCRQEQRECIVDFESGNVVMCRRCRDRGRAAHKCNPTYSEEVRARYRVRLRQESNQYKRNGHPRTPKKKAAKAKSPKGQSNARTAKRPAGPPRSTEKLVAITGLTTRSRAETSKKATSMSKSFLKISIRAKDIIQHIDKAEFVKINASAIRKLCKDQLKAIQGGADSIQDASDDEDVSDGAQD